MLDPAHAGERLCRARSGFARVRRRRARALPLLQLRRRDADHLMAPMADDPAHAPAAPRASPFTVGSRDPGSTARRGRLQTAHGAIDTPAFMPVATHGTVKGGLPAQLVDLGALILLAGAYHLSVRPGG